MRVIDGNILVFESGKEVRVDGADVALGLNGSLITGNFHIPEPHTLNRDEMMDLANHMVGLWAELRDLNC